MAVMWHSVSKRNSTHLWEQSIPVRGTQWCYLSVSHLERCGALKGELAWCCVVSLKPGFFPGCIVSPLSCYCLHGQNGLESRLFELVRYLELVSSQVHCVAPADRSKLPAQVEATVSRLDLLSFGR